MAVGTYFVAAQDLMGCFSDTVMVVLSQPDSIELSFTTFPESGINTLDGSATVSVSGGVSPYSYLWSNSQISSSIVYLEAGLYSVTVTDSNGCLAIDSVFVQSLVGVSENKLADFTIFPNPVSQQDLTIHPLTDSFYNVDFFDIQGALLFKAENCTGKMVLNTTHFSKGIYSLVITTQNGIESVPIIVN